MIIRHYEAGGEGAQCLELSWGYISVPKLFPHPRALQAHPTTPRPRLP